MSRDRDDIALLRGLVERFSPSTQEGEAVSFLVDAMDRRGLRARVDEAGNAVGLLRIGSEANGEGGGARVRLEGGPVAQQEEGRAGASYLSQHDPVLWFGLGAAEGTGEIGIHWPSGNEEPIGPLPAGAVHVLKEGAGRVASIGIGAGAAR